MLSNDQNQLHFKTVQAKHKEAIDADLKTYTKQVIKDTRREFGQHSGDLMEAFCDVLTRPANRLRGALAMMAYEMFGGTDKKVSTGIGRIMEIVQTYLLVADDVYDRSNIRRGAPTIHKMYEQAHEDNKWRGDALHFGESVALSQAFVGVHLLNQQVATLNVEPKRLLGAMNFINTYLRTTNEGQSNDIFNSVRNDVTEKHIDNVLEWKTASYTFDGPLRFGAMLAGASGKELAKLKEFALIAGRLFQITDDMLGTFGDVFEAGKSPLDDTREGKMTDISFYALKILQDTDKEFYESMLGNEMLTEKEFEKVRQLLIDNKVNDHVAKRAKKLAEEADSFVEKNWNNTFPEQAKYLTGLVFYMLERKH